MLKQGECTLHYRIKRTKENGSPINEVKKVNARCQIIDLFSTYYYGEGRSLSNSINIKIQRHLATSALDSIDFDGKHYRIINAIPDRNSSRFTILDCEEKRDAEN